MDHPAGTVRSVSAKQDWIQLAAQLRAEGKTRAEIARALRHHARREEEFDLAPLKALRLAHGWTQHDAALEWTGLWPELPKTYKDFSNWETARHTPGLDIFDKLAQLYSCDLADLLADRPGYRRRDPMAPVAHETVPSSTRLVGTLDLNRLTGDQTAVAAEVLAGDGEPFDVALSALAGRVTRIGPKQVGAHQEMEEALAGLYRSADPLAVLPATKTYADSVLELLDQPMGERVRAKLGAVAAGVHAQVGLWACHMHRPHLAYRYLSTACELATGIGDRGLQARTRGALSYLFSSAPRGGTGGRPDRALSLLDQALDLAQDSDSFTKGWLATWRADQYATLGNLDAARADVDAADAWLSANDPSGLQGFFARSSYGYGMKSHLESVRGLVFALGSQADEADQAFEQVQNSAPNVRRWIATQEHRGLGDVEAGDPDRACAALGVAVASAERENYGMGLMRAVGVRGRFDPGWSSLACVRDLDEQLHDAVLNP
jgi:transcriptional regulator with XRE-family HTH domain